MANQKLIKAFKERAHRLKLNQKDLRFRRTMAFLKAKGLLNTNLEIQPRPSVRLEVNDVLWAARNVEPRIIEVLPAALVHFPKNFTGLDRAPEELRKILAYIRRGEDDGPDFDGLQYKKMKFWANVPLKDRRTKPVREKRLTRVFRLSPKILEKLKALIKTGRFKNQTQALEAAVEAFGEPSS